MRELLLGGLALTLASLINAANAQEIKWRPAGSANNSQQTSAPDNSTKVHTSTPTIRLQNSDPAFASSQEPIGFPSTKSTPSNSAVKRDPQFSPVSFRPAEGNLLRPVIKAKHGPEILQPLPAETLVGETPLPNQKKMPGPENKDFEFVPMPRVIPNQDPLQPPNVTVVPEGSFPYVPERTIIPEGAVPYKTPVGDMVYEELPQGELVYEDEVCEDDCWCMGHGLFGKHGCFSCVHGSGWGGCPEASHCTIPRFYASAELLLWAMEDARLPPVATISTVSIDQGRALDPVTPGGFPVGAIGQPGTVVVFNEDEIDSPTFTGGRFTIGFSKLYHNVGIESTFFFVGETHSSFLASSNPDGSPFLVLPHFNPETNREDGIIAAAPDTFRGFIRAELATRLWGAELNFRKPWHCGCNYKVDFLCGFRFLEFRETFEVERNSTALRDIFENGTGPLVFSQGDNTRHVDIFGTRNRFYGGQIGTDFEYNIGRWIFGVSGKLALGSVHQVANIDGFLVDIRQARENFTGTSIAFAQSTNIGEHQQDQFAVVPEVGLKIGYQITPKLSAHVSYNFLYISSVARAGDQIDRSFTMGDGVSFNPQGPIFVFEETDHWAQGVNFGLNWKY